MSDRKKYRIGDRIVFIESESRRYPGMTRGKVYIVQSLGINYDKLSFNNCCVWVQDDNDNSNVWSNLRFVSLKEYRKMKLQRCLR